MYTTVFPQNSTSPIYTTPHTMSTTGINFAEYHCTAESDGGINFLGWVQLPRGEKMKNPWYETRLYLWYTMTCFFFALELTYNFIYLCFIDGFKCKCGKNGKGKSCGKVLCCFWHSILQQFTIFPMLYRRDINIWITFVIIRHFSTACINFFDSELFCGKGMGYLEVFRLGAVFTIFIIIRYLILQENLDTKIKPDSNYCCRCCGFSCFCCFCNRKECSSSYEHGMNDPPERLRQEGKTGQTTDIAWSPGVFTDDQTLQRYAQENPQATKLECCVEFCCCYTKKQTR